MTIRGLLTSILLPVAFVLAIYSNPSVARALAEYVPFLFPKGI